MLNTILDLYLKNDFLLFAVKKNRDINVMSCGWASEGKLFNKHVFTVYVRKSRYTFEFLEESENFYIATVDDKNLVEYIGTISGRKEDKIKTAGFKCKFSNDNLQIEGVNNLRKLRKILVLDFEDALEIDEKINYRYKENDLGHVAFFGELEE